MCSDIEHDRIWHKCLNISAQIVQKFLREIIYTEFRRIVVYEASSIVHGFFCSLDPVSISAILSMRQGHGQVTNGHQNQKFFFENATHDLQSLLHVELKKLGSFRNLIPCKSMTEKGRVNPGSHKVNFLDWFIQIKMCVSEPV